MKKIYIAPKAKIIDLKMDRSIMVDSNVSLFSDDTYNDDDFTLDQSGYRSNLWED